ncbi:unnamed protein product [Danaus chrysippus]|uniref:(African queen) hypothetical protein n=1 Tax=Danaus chrysippus TaxID=151541 RepID=A0A8J2Q518_9NEOP|nr:unnamed protein product [Danaus chrysippus]
MAFQLLLVLIYNGGGYFEYTLGADPGSPAGAVAGAPAGADTGVPAGAGTGVPAGARAAAPAAAGVDGFLVGGGAFNDLAAFLLPDFVMTVSNPSLSSSASEEDGVESDSASEPIGEQSMSHGLLFGQSGEAGLSVSNEVGFTSGFTSVNSLYASGYFLIKKSNKASNRPELWSPMMGDGLRRESSLQGREVCNVFDSSLDPVIR